MRIKTTIRLCSILFAALLTFGATEARAQDAASTNNAAAGTAASANTAPKAAKKAKKKSGSTNGVPFHGTLQAVNKASMTITLAGKEKPRVIQITSRTRITKSGKPATLSDLATGETVTGQIAKAANGQEEALRIKAGTAAGKKAKTAN